MSESETIGMLRRDDRFTPESRHLSRSPALRLGADIVAKVGEEQVASKNVQQSNRGEWISESTLRIVT